MTAVYILIGLVVWYVLGCMVLAGVDTDQRLYNWVKSAPNPLYGFLVVMLFPVTIYYFKKLN